MSAYRVTRVKIAQKVRQMCFQYLNVSGHLMIRKVDDRLFYFKSLALSSYIYFLVEDKEVPAVKL